MDLEQFLKEDFETIFRKLKFIEYGLVEQSIKEMDSRVNQFALQGIDLLDSSKVKTSYYKDFYSVMRRYFEKDKPKLKEEEVIWDENETFLYQESEEKWARKAT